MKAKSARRKTVGHGRLAGVLCLVLSGVLGGGGARAAGFSEDFSGNPLDRGWQVAGDSSLFAWDSTNQALQVTWDSSRTNSYFQRSLGTVLTKSDDFRFAFDLRLRDIATGTTPGKTYTFEVAVGLINHRSATNASFFRGAGQNVTSGPRNLVEFDYFPDAGLGATFASTVVSTNNRFAYGNNFPLELTPGSLFHIVLSYTATNQTLRTDITRDGQPFNLPGTNSLKEVVLTNTPDFRVDCFAVSSYSDGGQPGSFAGSVLAHGVLDNVEVVTPAPPTANLSGRFANSLWQVWFTARANWFYALDRTADFRAWTPVSDWVAGRDGTVTLVETNSSGGPAGFYRVVAERP
jgi:hypothetical protein